MVYTVKMPKISELRLLSKEIRNFPITGLGIVQCAEHLGYNDETVNFLKLFSGRIIFNSRTDFIRHCTLLEGLLREEKKQPLESSKSSEED